MDDIRLDCSDDELFESSEFVDWLAGLKAFLRETLSPDARLRMYAYKHDGADWVALDFFCTDRARDVTMTIAVTPGRAWLPSSFHSQIDFELPGLVEVIDFASSLVGADDGHLQLLPWDDAESAEEGSLRPAGEREASDGLVVS